MVSASQQSVVRAMTSHVFEQGTITKVPCMPLGQLLSDLGLEHINFFSLDVEGAELSVLQVRAAWARRTTFLQEPA